jgi:hypothetical protein
VNNKGSDAGTWFHVGHRAGAARTCTFLRMPDGTLAAVLFTSRAAAEAFCQAAEQPAPWPILEESDRDTRDLLRAELGRGVRWLFIDCAGAVRLAQAIHLADFLGEPMLPDYHSPGPA